MRETSWGRSLINAANTNRNGTGSAVLLYEADRTCWAEKARFLPAGTNSDSVIRLYLNNGRDRTVAANNILLGEGDLGATTTSEVVAQTPVEVSIQSYLRPGDRIYAAVSVDLEAEAGWYGSVFLGEHRSDFAQA